MKIKTKDDVNFVEIETDGRTDLTFSITHAQNPNEVFSEVVPHESIYEWVHHAVIPMPMEYNKLAL